MVYITIAIIAAVTLRAALAQGVVAGSLEGRWMAGD